MNFYKVSDDSSTRRRVVLLSVITVIDDDSINFLSFFDICHPFFVQYSTTFEIRFLGAYILIDSDDSRVVEAKKCMDDIVILDLIMPEIDGG
ncbi:MAG: hypothetical protein GY705_20040 [Bacteroidetes bacterium]|nr:hypothetical protein [Bacteroidota bacterium]